MLRAPPWLRRQPPIRLAAPALLTASRRPVLTEAGQVILLDRPTQTRLVSEEGEALIAETGEPLVA